MCSPAYFASKFVVLWNLGDEVENLMFLVSWFLSFIGERIGIGVFCAAYGLHFDKDTYLYKPTSLRQLESGLARVHSAASPNLPKRRDSSPHAFSFVVVSSCCRTALPKRKSNTGIGWTYRVVGVSASRRPKRFPGDLRPPCATISARLHIPEPRQFEKPVHFARRSQIRHAGTRRQRSTCHKSFGCCGHP